MDLEVGSDIGGVSGKRKRGNNIIIFQLYLETYNSNKYLPIQRTKKMTEMLRLRHFLFSPFPSQV